MMERNIVVHYKSPKSKRTACGIRLRDLGNSYSTCWNWVNCLDCNELAYKYMGFHSHCAFSGSGCDVGNPENPIKVKE